MALVVAACSGAPSSELPRTTRTDVAISVSHQQEASVIPGCHAYWQSRGLVPPIGACEEMGPVRRFIAQRGTQMVEATLVGEPAPDPLRPMQLVASARSESISLLIVLPPTEAAWVRLIDPNGREVDRVSVTGALAALAGPGPDLTVEALAAGGAVIAACEPHADPSPICSPAPLPSMPVTTIPGDTAR